MIESDRPVLRDIESKLAGLVEGTFGRMFRSEVTPAELARGLAREMEATRRQGLDRTWVAQHYDVYLSPADHRRIVRDGADGPLGEELSNSLLLHAREQRFALAHPPRVAFHREDELTTGRYGVRAVHDEAPSAAAQTPDRSRAPAARTARPREAVPSRRDASQHADDAPPAAPRPSSEGPPPIDLVLNGRREPVPPAGGTVGRSRECDVVIASAEVSRQHAELRPRGTDWVIFDLGSTNGVRVNGVDVGGPGDAVPVRPGDRVDLGTVVVHVKDRA